MTKLTEREMQVLKCVAADMSSSNAAKLLAMSPATFRTHRSHITRKLDVGSTAAAIAVAFRHGWIH